MDERHTTNYKRLQWNDADAGRVNDDFDFVPNAF